MPMKSSVWMSAMSASLADDIARRLVETQPEEGRVAQAAVAGPFHERDLGDELGLDPRGGLGDALLGLERRGLADQRGEAAGEVVQRRAREARPDLARVAQLVALEVTDEQGAEIGAGALRRGEAADDQLLLGGALELEPVTRAGRHVRRAEALGDQTLPAGATGVREQ